MGGVYQSLAVTTVDALFIATATAFLSKGSSFGTQRYGVFPKYPGMISNHRVIHLEFQLRSDCDSDLLLLFTFATAHNNIQLVVMAYLFLILHDLHTLL